MNSKKLWDWLNNYFNGKLFRDCRYISDSVAIYHSDSKTIDVNYYNRTHKQSMEYYMMHNSNYSNPTFESKKKFRMFMQNKKHHNGKGNLYHQLTYHKSLSDFLGNDNHLTNCLYFDFDVHDETISIIKKDLANARMGIYPSWYAKDDRLIVNVWNEDSEEMSEREFLKGKQRLEVEKQCRSTYVDYVTSNDYLISAYDELMTVCDYFQNLGAVPLPICTGGAGFHLNIFFEESEFINPTAISKGYGNFLTDKLNLKTLDDAVYRNVKAQVQRTPFSVHKLSNKQGFPFSIEDDFDDVIGWFAKGNAPIIEFDFEEYKSHEAFLNSVHNVDKNLDKIESKKKEVAFKNVSQFKGNTDDIFKDMRVLWDYLASKGIVKPKDKVIDGKYYRVFCPFHDDNTSSALVRNKFTCYGCGFVDDDKLSYFEFLRKLFNLQSDDEVKAKMREIVKDSSKED